MAAHPVPIVRHRRLRTVVGLWSAFPHTARFSRSKFSHDRGQSRTPKIRTSWRYDRRAQPTAAAGDKHAAERLAWLRIERMSDAELRSAWEDTRVADAYVQRLFSRGDETGLAELADAEVRWRSQLARWRLADLLYQRGDRHKLARRADAGDADATTKLAKLLAECGEEDELARRVADGDWHAEIELDKLLAARGRRL